MTNAGMIGTMEQHPPPVVPARLLTPEDLAERWSVPRSSIWAMSRRDTIPNVKIGRHYRYRLDAIEAFELAGGLSDEGEA